MSLTAFFGKCSGMSNWVSERPTNKLQWITLWSISYFLSSFHQTERAVLSALERARMSDAIFLVLTTYVASMGNSDEGLSTVGHFYYPCVSPISHSYTKKRWQGGLSGPRQWRGWPSIPLEFKKKKKKHIFTKILRNSNLGTHWTQACRGFFLLSLRCYWYLWVKTWSPYHVEPFELK